MKTVPPASTYFTNLINDYPPNCNTFSSCGNVFSLSGIDFSRFVNTFSPEWIIIS